ncbi:MAG: glutathione S-transferase family protein [Alphaproteobacteria bacterium]|nr:glutathione S-transferase family protein [Alphaproteobacteria bacterium]
MTYTLFTARRSGAVAPECLLAEAGAAVKLVDVDLKTEQQLSPEHRKVNPLGRVPVLVLPDGSVMTESAAILLAIAELHPQSDFLPPPGSAERFQLYRWLMFASNNVYEAIGREDYPARYSTNAEHAPSIRARAREDLRRFWSMIEAGLKPRPHCIGGRFTALDVYLANLSQWTVPREWLLAECPGIAGLPDIVRSRPRMATIWKKHFPLKQAA